MMYETSYDGLNNYKDYTKTTCNTVVDDLPNKKQRKWKFSDIKLLREQITQRISSQTDDVLRHSGFNKTDSPTIVRCNDCNYEVSDWKTNKDLLKLHTTESPTCPFVCKLKSSTSLANNSHSLNSLPSTVGISKSISKSDSNESPSKRQKIEANNNIAFNALFETNTIQQVRKRTFSYWPPRHIPSQAQMIEAGFFNCNVGDRVICIYCNLICQQWTPHTDDPTEVHKTLSPNCIYVKSKLIRRDLGPILIVNENSASIAAANGSGASGNPDTFRCNEFVHTAACHAGFVELPKRMASFTAWTSDNLPSVDDLVRAGFFYTGVKAVVTCFYCNGSLQNWGPNDNPTIEHARWFPHCAYAKQLCGDELYRKIQESKRAQQERARMNEARDKTGSTNPNSNNSAANNLQLVIPDESTLSRLVAARLDLPISQSLLGEFKLSIIKRCWEDQLRLKHDDFVSDCDLRMACTILQKQISFIDGKKENIVVPSIRMKKLREDAEKQRAEAKAREEVAKNPTTLAPTPAIMPIESNDADIEMTTPEQTTTQATVTSNPEEAKVPKPVAANTNQQKDKDDVPLANACVLCLTEEKRLACIPCGHFVACVPCGHSLRCCPICRREIEAFVRIFV